MGTPKFIFLTDNSNRKERVNGDRIIRYFPSNRGTTVIYGCDHSEWYAETPEQIDAMLAVGGPDLSVVAAKALGIEASRLRDEAEGVHNATIRNDLLREAAAFRKAAGIVRAALSAATGSGEA